MPVYKYRRKKITAAFRSAYKIMLWSKAQMESKSLEVEFIFKWKLIKRRNYKLGVFVVLSKNMIWNTKNRRELQ